MDPGVRTLAPALSLNLSDEILTLAYTLRYTHLDTVYTHLSVFIYFSTSTNLCTYLSYFFPHTYNNISHISILYFPSLRISSYNLSGLISVAIQRAYCRLCVGGGFSNWFWLSDHSQWRTRGGDGEGGVWLTELSVSAA